MSNEFTEALARLDAEIADAEANLARLRNMRTGAEAFLKYAGVRVDTNVLVNAAEPDTSDDLKFTTVPVPKSPTELVMSAFEGVAQDAVLLLDQIEARLKSNGVELERQKIRNGIHYAVRKGYLERAASRGAWRLASTNADAPVSAGASETGELNGDSPQQEGGSGGTEALHGHDGLALDALDHRGHGLSSAAIGGGTETH